jgi:rhomboid protease GluP
MSAGWLHGHLLHIVFNMLWVRDLGPSTANVIGPARTIVIYTISGVCGFLLSSFAFVYLPYVPFFSGAPITVGASASIFGLLGALVHYGRKSGSHYVHSQALYYAVILFAFGALFPGGGVDNYAHAGGFLGGYATSAFFNPLTRERGDHVLAAAICLIATVLAVLASVLHGLSLAPGLR